MNSDRHNPRYNASNEDLGLFLPNSIIPDIMQELDGRAFKGAIMKPKVNFPKVMSMENETKEIGSHYQEMYQGERMQGLFNPERKYNSHSNVGGYFSGRNNNINFGGNYPVQGWVNNNMSLFSNNYYSNNSNGSGNYNSGMGKLTPNSSNCNNNNIFLASNKKNSSNSSLRYNDTEYSSRDEMLNFNNYGNLNNTFNNDYVNFNQGSNCSRTNLCQIENSMANLSIGSNHGSHLGSLGTTHGTNSLTSSMGNLSGLNKPKKKGFSTGTVSHNYQNNFKKNFNPKQKKVNTGNNLRERDDEEEDLETFLEELEGDLHTFICSQKGSRIMQKFLNKISPENLNSFIHRLGSNISVLMIDLYGNYFCQKLFQSCSAEQRIIILNYISKDLVNISYDNSGTHALQSLLEILNLQEEETIILNAVKNFALEMSYDNNATHVIQKILVCICEEKREFLNNIIIDNLKSLSIDCNGICVVKKFVNTNKTQELKEKVIGIITGHCLEIVQSPFGNYAVQHLIEEWGMCSCKEILNIIQQNIISLSMQKYSSNVVEKCLEIADKEMKRGMIDDILNPGKLLGLLKNKYGSFVLQKAVNYLAPEVREEIKVHLQSRLNITSSKEKARINAFFESLSR